MREIQTNEIQTELITLATTQTEDEIYCVYDKPVVFRSMNNDVNVDYCISNNITIIDTGNMGGTIVANTGDVGVAILKKEGWTVGADVLNLMCDVFKDRIPNLRVDGNDLIGEDNFKLTSYASFNVGNRVIYTIIAISINPNIEDIVNICSKPMNKVPKGLSDFGITREEIVDFIKSFNI